MGLNSNQGLRTLIGGNGCASACARREAAVNTWLSYPATSFVTVASARPPDTVVTTITVFDWEWNLDAQPQL
jgi:hypothetical protein